MRFARSQELGADEISRAHYDSPNCISVLARRFYFRSDANHRDIARHDYRLQICKLKIDEFFSMVVFYSISKVLPSKYTADSEFLSFSILLLSSVR